MFPCGVAGYFCDDPAYRTTTASRAPVDLSECFVLRLSHVGDGYCDDEQDGFNTFACAWDGGDCCLADCISRNYVCGTNGYMCRGNTTHGLSTTSAHESSIEMSYSSVARLLTTAGTAGTTSVFHSSCILTSEQQFYLGDGYCDEGNGLNSEACAWDGGDCCESTCQQNNVTTFDCGVIGYTCRNPNAADAESQRCRGASSSTSACLTLFSTDITLEDCLLLKRNTAISAVVAGVSSVFVHSFGWNISILDSSSIECGSIYLNINYNHGTDSGSWLSMLPQIQNWTLSNTQIQIPGLGSDILFQFWSPTVTEMPQHTLSPSLQTPTLVTEQPMDTTSVATTVLPSTTDVQNQNNINSGVDALETTTLIFVVTAIGILIFITILITGICICRRQQNARREANDVDRSLSHLDLKSTSMGIEMQDLPSHHYPSLSSASLDTDAISLDIIGQNPSFVASPILGLKTPIPSERRRPSIQVHDAPISPTKEFFALKLQKYFVQIGKAKFIDKIPEILRRNRGKERRLCLKLMKKYGGFIDTSDVSNSRDDFDKQTTETPLRYARNISTKRTELV